MVIDRFDGRALLDEKRLFIKRKKSKKEEEERDEEEEEVERRCDIERYRDLGGKTAGVEEEEEEEALASWQQRQQEGGRSGQQEEEEEEEEGGGSFLPSFPVPDGLVLPTSSKQHRLIGMTARRVRGDPQLVRVAFVFHLPTYPDHELA